MKIAKGLPLLLLFFIPLARLGAQTSAGDDAAWSIPGNWNIVEGSYEGSNYEGAVRIAMENGAYNFHWNAGGSEYDGVGLMLDGIVGVGWGTDGRSGVAIYKIVSESELAGVWATSTADAPVGREEAHGGKLSAKESTFKVSGTNPNSGTPYTGTLRLKKNGDAYDVIWKIADDTFYGAGMRMGNVFIIGWGTSRDNVGVVAYKFEGDKAAGRWCLPNSTTLGIENLARPTQGATPGR